MKGPSPTFTSRTPSIRLYQAYVAALVICLAGNLGIRLADRAASFPVWLLAVLAILASLPLAVAAAMFWRRLRRDLDELLQRVVLEGLAFALTVYLPLAALYVNLRAAGVSLSRLDPPDIVLTPALLVAIGIALAWRRYQ